MTDFNNKQIYIVTGASSGIGEATALMLNEQGASVVAIARNEQRLNVLKEKAKYPENIFLEMKDLIEDIENLPQYIKALKDKYAKFSGLVCCAGIGNIVSLQSVEYEDLDTIFKINYFSPIFMVKGFADKRNNIGKGASIVIVSSVAAKCLDKGQIIYGGSKAALCASMKIISKELISKGIRVNCVLPSNINTPMTQVYSQGYEEPPKAAYPLGFGEPDDVANMITYLLSSKAKFVSGQNYVIDSGGVW